MRKVVIGGIVVIALLAVAGASGSKNSTTVTPAGAAPAASAGGAAAAPSAAPVAKVGDTVKSGNWSYVATKVEKTKTLVWTDLGNKTDALGTWLVVSMTLRNVGTQNFPINTFDFSVTDSAGTKYAHSDKLEALTFVRYRKLTPLGSQFPPGIDVQTALVFDVNPSATGLRLILKQANDQPITLE